MTADLPGTIVVITNKSVGADENLDRTRKIHAAFAAANATTEILEVDGPEMTAAAREAAAHGARVVVAAGGDGTINAIAAALVGTSTPLGVIPMGTLNHFAQDTGIPLDMTEAAALIVNGTASAVDVATVNGRIFINNSSIGAYPLMVRERDAQRSRFKRSKWWAMIRACVAIFKRFPTFAVRISVDGQTVYYQTPALMVGNNAYALDARMLGSRERMDAGVLGVYAVRARTRWSAFTLILSALFADLEDHDLVDCIETGELSLEANRGELDVSLDGEVVRMKTPLEYRIVKQALLVMRP